MDGAREVAPKLRIKVWAMFLTSRYRSTGSLSQWMEVISAGIGTRQKALARGIPFLGQGFIVGFCGKLLAKSRQFTSDRARDFRGGFPRIARANRHLLSRMAPFNQPLKNGKKTAVRLNSSSSTLKLNLSASMGSGLPSLRSAIKT